MVHSSWQWLCEAMKTQPSYGISEMLTKYMERYCVQHCDILLSPSQYMFDWCETDIPSIPARRYLLPYLCEMGLENIGHKPAKDKIIFFGRLEARKGLVLFLEALAILARRRGKDRPPVDVFFLGKDGYTMDGGSPVTIDRYRTILGGYVTLTCHQQSRPARGHRVSKGKPRCDRRLSVTDRQFAPYDHRMP